MRSATQQAAELQIKNKTREKELQKIKSQKQEEAAQVNMIVPETQIEGSVSLVDYDRFFSFSYG